MTAPAPNLQCCCGHAKADHIDGEGECSEPTDRCECLLFMELCPKCRHGKYDHNGLNGQCSRIVQKTREPCGCSNYIVGQQVAAQQQLGPTTLTARATKKPHL